MSLAWYIKRHLNIRSWFPFFKVSKWSIGSSTDRILKVVVKEMINFISCQFGQILRVHTFFPHISALHLDVNAYTSYVTSLITTLLQSLTFLTMLTTHVQCYKLDRRTRWTKFIFMSEGFQKCWDETQRVESVFPVRQPSLNPTSHLCILTAINCWAVLVGCFNLPNFLLFPPGSG